MNARDKLESLQAELDDFQDEIRSQGEDILRDAAKEVFDEVEGLTKFFCRGWPARYHVGENYTQAIEGYWGNLSYGWNSYCEDYQLSDDDGIEQEPDFFGWSLGSIYDQPTFNSAEECPKVEYVNSGVVDQCLAHRKVQDMAYLCDVVYDTNYKVFFTKRDDGSVDLVSEHVVYGTNCKAFFTKRDDGSVDIVYEDYDRGY